MIIGLAGYHSSGKSTIGVFLAEQFSWKYVVKRKLLKNWFGGGDDEYVWTAWYRDLYKSMGSYGVMHHLLKHIKYDKNSNDVIVLDAIHTSDEWKAIKEVDPNSLLAGVFIPKEYRLARSSPEDLVLDITRERYWHDGENCACLLAQVEWSFCGTANLELRTLEAKMLFDHLAQSRSVG